MSRKIIFSILLLAIVAFVSAAKAEDQYAAVYGNGKNAFSLATGSPGELGLLKVLGEAFAEQEDAQLKWKKAGSGESLKLLKEKQVDMIMVHAPAAEKKAVSDGWAIKRTLIGSNEFFVVGPATDPAAIAKATSVADAYSRIATASAKFFSRGDNSGTHKKEMDIWKKAGIEPAGDWYIVTKDFMTATLKRANDEGGYFMTDSSTWIAEKNNMPKLKILFRGDKFIINTYHALCQPEKATPGADTAAKFINFVASEKGQDIIREFGKAEYGEGLYNDATYAEQFND
ncbi:substrate-binding domain-containing protein [Desulfopila aestuarii]|uniref:Tungstate transport system substrate-binding protein n=1 Tax=Desulfopila aestuarii DSM 18488 TaxID=1121416 RepID=A0A1M7YMM3_9BACT|nr:substrate-binding domain-containing protein [Desulfopila aestuarii]SHO53889.1 tungstate transport system substrate-binding protein [Desulfopila aestuarii DSM 18488]